MNLRLLGTAGLVAAFTLTACGSNSGGATLSKADWVTQANAICKDLNTRSNAVKPTSMADLGTAMNSISQIATEDIAKLSALKPPAEIQSDVTTLLTSYGQINTALKAAAATAIGGNPTGALQAMQSSETTLKPAVTAVETRLGLSECSK